MFSIEILTLNKFNLCGVFQISLIDYPTQKCNNWTFMHSFSKPAVMILIRFVYKDPNKMYRYVHVQWILLCCNCLQGSIHSGCEWGKPEIQFFQFDCNWIPLFLIRFFLTNSFFSKEYSTAIGVSSLFYFLLS